jgi:phosphomannomutase
MPNIKFGTDGWRAIIAKEFTVDNVKRVAEGTARWMKEKGETSAVIGYDCRFGSKMFAEATALVLGAYGLKVYLSRDFIATPVVSFGVVHMKAGLGVVITASHNPPAYNGYKLKSKEGGPMFSENVEEVEALMPDRPMEDLPSIKQLEEKGLLEYPDLEGVYIEHVRANFDLDLINSAGFNIAYDAMFGSGKKTMATLLPSAALLHCDDNPGFNGIAPEPIHKNLHEFSQFIKDRSDIHVGVANDGDADRLGMYDEDGNFVDAHHLLLLLLMYMCEYKKENGKVVVSIAVTDKLQQLAEMYGQEFVFTKIGFKHICSYMINEKVIVGGEEAGGFAVAGHIPERDGIWTGLVVLEYMAKTGKSLKELVEDIHKKVGSFAYDRDDLHITEELKQAVIKRCNEDPYTVFGDYIVEDILTIDGYKFMLDKGAWIMIRPSGTEPVLRVYAQAENPSDVRKLLDAAKVMMGVSS